MGRCPIRAALRCVDTASSLAAGNTSDDVNTVISHKHNGRTNIDK